MTVTCLPPTDDECRMIIFKEPIADREMRGHVIKVEEVPDQGSCRVLCFIEPNCVSINFAPKQKGKHKCELNNATEESQPVPVLHKKMDCIYLGIEVKSLTVEFQCVQFICSRDIASFYFPSDVHSLFMLVLPANQILC